MTQKMSLEDYKLKVKECLTKKYNCTTLEANRLMTEYENDFQEALNDFSWPPMTMALAMQMGY